MQGERLRTISESWAIIRQDGKWSGQIAWTPDGECSGYDTRDAAMKALRSGYKDGSLQKHSESRNFRVSKIRVSEVSDE